MALDSVDVLTVGAGASGAWSLSQTGLSVICLEQGDRVEAAAYPSTARSWEVSRLGDYHPSPNVRKLAARDWCTWSN